MEPDALVPVSSTDALRRLICDSLTQAAQQIFAAVERTVAAYEEQASGLRRELERRPEPEIKVETADELLFPGAEPAQQEEEEEEEEAAGGGGDEEQHKQPSVAFICHPEEQKEDEYSERAALTPSQDQDQDQDHLTGLDRETASRSEATFPAHGLNSSPPSGQSDRKRFGSCGLTNPQQHVHLKIRVLKNSEIHVLSNEVFQKYPLHELQCPRGLQEADFLKLLRSTYPQLAADQPFDLFVTDRSKRLRPLEVNTLTPEEICRGIRSTGAGRSALYVRPKTQDQPQATDEEPAPSQREATAVEAPSASSQSRPRVRTWPRAQPAEGNHSSSQDNDPEAHINIRVRVLDSQINMLTTSVFQKYPLHELQCPRGLQEADFLKLLRSTYPQLAADQPFDLFVTDGSKRLRPLEVNTLTPEEICRGIRSRGAGRSALHVRPKAPEEPQVTDEELDLSQRDEAPSVSNQTRPYTGLSLPRLQVAKGNRSRHQDNKPQTQIGLKIQVLEDSHVNTLTRKVLHKYPLKKLKFPCGLQEADFLSRLRSTFPRLAADKPFDIFMTDKSRKLQPLKVNTLTPEEIYRTIKSVGNSSLYIRLKSPKKRQSRKKHFLPLQKHAAAKDSLSTFDQTRLNLRVQSDEKNPGRREVGETQNDIGLRIRFLGDTQIDVLTKQVWKKYPLQKLQCPRGLQEADFLDLLKSTFPQLAADKPFEIFTSDKSRRLYPLRINTVTPEEIHRLIRFNSVLYIQLKAKEETLSCAENVWRRRDATAKSSPSTSDVVGLNSSVLRQRKVNYPTVGSQEGTEAEAGDDDHESLGLWSLQSLPSSEGETDEDEASDGDGDWEPDSSDAHPSNSVFRKMTKRQRVKKQNAKVNRGDQICKVCRVVRRSTKMLIKHAWRHVDDPERCCGVCGGGSDTAEELRRHLQSHLKTHSCHICGKSFLSVSGLKGHLAQHKRPKTYECKTCYKSFPEELTLNNHECVRAVDGPYKCDICQKACVSKMKLKRHTATHTHKKPYSCSTCRKPFRKLEALSQHVANHFGHTQVRARTHVCQVCDKRFYTGKKLKLHLRSHATERQHVCTKCYKQFPAKMHLMVHMRVHAGQSPAPTHQVQETLSAHLSNY